MTGFKSKKDMAQDKLNDDDDNALLIAYQSGYYDGKKAAQPAQEPLCYASINKQGDVCSTLKQRDSWRTVPLYTTPPQRKPLTINEVEQILAQHNYEIHGDRARYIVRMTEAAHGIKEKNT